MPIERPTLTELKERIKADYAARLPGAAIGVRRGNIEVQTSVDAASAHMLYGLITEISRQILPDSADADHLARHASIWGITRKPAAKAFGNLILTGTNGAEIPAGTVWERADGVRYATDSLAVISEGSATVSATAVDAGADGDYEAEAQLTMVGYVPNITQVATVAAPGLGGGADIETDDSVRARIIGRIQTPPAGGAEHDYVAWAREVPGVTRAYCYPCRMGEGTVGVTVLTDAAETGPIPSAAVIDDVQSYIDALRPVTASVTVFACAALPVAFTLSISPDTAAIRAAIAAELEDFFRREAEPEGGLALSRISEAISQAAGEFSHAIVSPTTNPDAGAGQLLTLGSITWE
jgi:uncharacterized phage protein gp47/JayE